MLSLPAATSPEADRIASAMSTRWWVAAIVAAGLTTTQAQSPTAPRNDLPQPYRTKRDWGELPPSIKKWPAVTAVECAPDGTVYVVERCSDNSCVGRTEPPILKFDRSGKLLKAWGEGLFNFPHGATLDS